MNRDSCRLLCDATRIKREDVIAAVRQHEADLRRLGVESLYLFGSTARDEARQDSDVDLFFDYKKGKLGLLEVIGIEEPASQMLGCKADATPRTSINRYIRPYAEKDPLRVFLMPGKSQLPQAFDLDPGITRPSARADWTVLYCGKWAAPRQRGGGPSP